jgi:hypothetical protein
VPTQVFREFRGSAAKPGYCREREIEITQADCLPPRTGVHILTGSSARAGARTAEHASRIVRMDIESDFISGNPFVGKLPDEAAGDERTVANLVAILPNGANGLRVVNVLRWILFQNDEIGLFPRGKHSVLIFDVQQLGCV